jgi:hypothetical protein
LTKSTKHYLVGKSSIKALFEMSDRFDKKLRKEFEKNMAVSQPWLNFSNLSKSDESDLDDYYFISIIFISNSIQYFFDKKRHLEIGMTTTD